MSGYSPPPLTEDIVLAGGYTPPALTEPVVLCATEPADDVTGTLSAALDPPALDLELAATQQPQRLDESLYATLPLLRPDAPTLSAAGDRIHRAIASADLPTPSPPLLLVARESSHHVQIDASLTPPALDLALSAAGDRVHAPRIATDLPAPALPLDLAAAGEQLIDLPDTDGISAGMRQQQAAATAAPLGVSQQQTRRVATSMRELVAGAMPIHVPVSLRDAQMQALRRPATAPHQHGQRIRSGARAEHTETIRIRRAATAPHQHGQLLRSGTRADHAETIRIRTRRRADHQHAEPAPRRLAAGAQSARATVSRLHIRWQHADHRAPGRWWPIYQPPGLTIVLDCAPYTPRPLSCPVVLGVTVVAQPPCPETDPEPGTIIVTTLEVYHVLNNFTLVRAGDATPIPTRDFSASIDRDSWTWSWNASIPASALSILSPEEPGSPREVIATVNGQPLRLLAERIRRDRRHAGAWLHVSGRGRAAWLSEPYAPIETRYADEIRTAQQLMADALTINGVPVGWSIDWQLTDWTVPADTWSHSGTYIESALRIAEAGGGYIQAHDTDDALIVLPHYPAAPWDWSGLEPDIALPEAVVEIEGIEWHERPPYNAVWITGGATGRKDKIRRTGTAGDRPAPTVVDPLATHADMTRQRGLAILADTGRQADISLRLPVLEEVGIIHPGLLIDYTESGITRRGLSRGVSFEHRHPELWQTVRIETHE